MGKRKIAKTEEEIRRKIQKLQNKLQATTNRRINFSSEEDLHNFSHDQLDVGCGISQHEEASLSQASPLPASPHASPRACSPCPISPPVAPPPLYTVSLSPTPGTSAEAQPEVMEDQDLDEDTLQLLGDAPKTDITMDLKELQYHKIIQNISTKYDHKYTKELQPRNTGSTDKDVCENLAKDPGRHRRVQSKGSLPKVLLKKGTSITPAFLEGGGRESVRSPLSHVETCHENEARGFRSHAPIFTAGFDQKSYFSPQVQWWRTTHKTRKFKKVTHCLFDMDGTIIDSECQYHQILKELCAKHGKKYSKELESKNFGATEKEICANVVKELQLNMSADQLQEELKVVTRVRLPKAPLKKGMERLLNHLFRSGVLFALATNATRREVRPHIATKPKIFRMFHHMVCAGDPDLDRAKPFPDPYLVAASKFPDKPPPVKCLVFEDSLVGLESGLAAGMQVVMTPPKSLPIQECAAATLVLKSVLDFNPEEFGLPPFTDNVKNKPKVS